jgi:hypothetical protein
MDVQVAESGARRLFADVQELIAGAHRWQVPWGFEVLATHAMSRASAFSSALIEYETTVEMRMRVRWETIPGVVPATASETPAVEEVGRLRVLVEARLASGDFWEFHAPSLETWEATLPDGADRPSKVDWSLVAMIRSH